MLLGEVPHLLDVGDKQHPLQKLGVGLTHLHLGPGHFKGSVQRDFRPPVFISFEPTWTTDQ